MSSSQSPVRSPAAAQDVEGSRTTIERPCRIVERNVQSTIREAPARRIGRGHGVDDGAQSQPSENRCHINRTGATDLAREERFEPAVAYRIRHLLELRRGVAAEPSPIGHGGVRAHRSHDVIEPTLVLGRVEHQGVEHVAEQFTLKVVAAGGVGILHG